MELLSASQLFSAMNLMGKQKQSFVFLTDAFLSRGYIATLEDAGSHLRFKTPCHSNISNPESTNHLKEWNIFPQPYKSYQSGFKVIMNHIRRGDSFLLNYTQPTRVETNLTLEELFYTSQARYKVHLKEVFTCFSPETFVTINENGLISSFPMKGTADTTDENAEEILLADSKEIAEHHTIVDLIRNDLSRVATEVSVEKFRYTERIHTNQKELIQVSSKISGKLPEDWQSHIGDIFSELLPAGSVTGAPKTKTVEIIRKSENYERGWYTGVFGIFDGKSLDSVVLIRYIEKQQDRLVFKSGGGITFQSDCNDEYNEMIKKVYVPFA
jgi:para-aminobenzoate synthetase component I